MAVPRLASLVLVLGLAGASRLALHSFEPPYDSHDGTGNRVVARQWRTGGTAEVNQFFVRVTPDRQSRRGAIWSRKALGVNSASTVLKFRISGQGKSLFGDGMALWVVQQGFHVEGEFHGFTDRFSGVGIIVDTFKNTESSKQHRDIAVVTNDGTLTLDEMMENVQGCDARVRYSNTRGDFTVEDMSRLKVTVDGTTLTVAVDASNAGEWRECATVELSRLSPGWLRRAHIGITATTGQLADNHDVISLVTYSSEESLEEELSNARSQRRFALDPEATHEQHMAELGEAVGRLRESVGILEQNVEFEMARVRDHIRTVTAKLEDKEDRAEGRIEDLEMTVKTKVDGTVEERMRRVELQLGNRLNRQVNAAQRSLKASVKDMESSANEAWQVPAVVLLLLLFGAGASMAWFNKQLHKSYLP